MNTYRVTLGNLEALPRGMNNGLGLLLLLRGALTLEAGGETTQLAKGDIAVLNHMELYAANASGPNVALFIQLPFEYLDAACPGVTAQHYECCSAGAEGTEALYAPVKQGVARMAFIYFQKEPGWELLFQSVLFETLYELGRGFGKAAPSGESKASGDAGHMGSILAYLHQNYKNRVSLEEVAAKEYMSVQYLSKLFRQKLGSTFSEYLNTLRLDSALQDLLYTKDSVTKIALNNGFASAKALTLQFSRRFGATPQEYRRQNAQETGHTAPRATEAGGSLDELVRFIDSHERRTRSTAHISHTVVLGATQPYALPDFKRIVNIGHLRNSTRADARAVLSTACQKLGIGYVYFRGFLDYARPAKGHGALFRTYDFHEAFNMFCGMGLVPFIQLELDDLFGPTAPERALENLIRLVASLRQSQPPAYFARWQFELLGTPETLARHFAAVQAALCSVHPALCTGLRLEAGGGTGQQAAAQAMLRTLAATPPGFVSLALDPNSETAPVDAAAFEAFHQSYHATMAARAHSWLAAAGMEAAPLYLMDWNTLTGKSTVEAGEFHRTALLADVLAGLMGLVSGFGVHLSLFSMSHNTGIITHALSLFVYRNIRRPMFFVYRAFTSLKPRVLFHRDNVLLTADADGRYAVLLYNPCYMNPFQSLDNIRRESHERVLELTIEGLQPGKYRVKKFLMDKENGSLYHSWVKLDFSIPLDEEDVDEYLENVSNPSVLLFETEVETSYTLQQQLAMNATALYIIKRIG